MSQDAGRRETPLFGKPFVEVILLKGSALSEVAGISNATG